MCENMKAVKSPERSSRNHSAFGAGALVAKTFHDVIYPMERESFGQVDDRNGKGTHTKRLIARFAVEMRVKVRQRTVAFLPTYCIF